MIKTVDEVVKRLEEQYQPERVILFGSRVAGGAAAESDIDLVVIKETNKSLLERQIEVERILADREVPLDIVVYTAEEVRYLLSLGSPFIEEVMEKGKVLYMRKATEGWLRDAEEELESAKILMEHGKYRSACYHSQQCVEKILKALLLEQGRRPARTHDILQLFNDARTSGWEIKLTLDDAIFLNSIFRGRYPTEEGLLPYGEPLRTDTERAVSIAIKLREHAAAALKE